MKRCIGLGWMCGLVVLSAATTASAVPPLKSLLPFRRVEANPDKDYTLSDSHGPWMIIAACFQGPQATAQAQALVVELRRSKLEAFTHVQESSHHGTVEGRGVDRYGRPKKMRYANPTQHDSIAVLVGHFESVDDPKLERTLERLKYAQPTCLTGNEQASGLSYASLRAFHRKLTSDVSKRKQGPMANAFATRNPLQEVEQFATGGLDPFVVEMNRAAEFSLLANPGRFTVRVASFRGHVTWNRDEIERSASEPASDRLERAAIKAHRLTRALRDKGYEAYEFHDRHESIVTIGSFDQIASQHPNGRTEMNPAVQQIIQTFTARPQSLPGQAAFGYQPVVVGGIPCELQPAPVEVPKKSIAHDYAQNRQLFR